MFIATVHIITAIDMRDKYLEPEQIPSELTCFGAGQSSSDAYAAVLGAGPESEIGFELVS